LGDSSANLTASSTSSMTLFSSSFTSASLIRPESNAYFLN